MTTISVLRPVAVRQPPGAAWAAAAFVHLLAWFERSAQRRETMNRATEAAAVRAYAQELEDRDPRFAADLRAAADRHESAA